ncbi:hypothetical protein ACGFZP_02795 [Kitasatospora sp. NPDC048239]|uniref:hypothetical protein n=1 Tax=Kitasatospora sp. NPDC048239 TaxID=3364046 RepID=UPI0037111604
MTGRVTVRVGSESAVLVPGTGRDRVREAAGILGGEMLSALGMQVLWLPLGAVAGVVAHLALGVDAAAAARAVGAVSLLEVVVTGVLSGWTDLTRPSRLEFSPPQAPVRVRAVRLGLPGRWRPVAELGGVRVAHRITEPVDGDPRPCRETFTVERRATGLRRAPLSAYDVPGDPRPVFGQVRDLLGPVGLSVEIGTARYVRRRGGPPIPAPGPRPGPEDGT